MELLQFNALYQLAEVMSESVQVHILVLTVIAVLALLMLISAIYITGQEERPMLVNFSIQQTQKNYYVTKTLQERSKFNTTVVHF